MKKTNYLYYYSCPFCRRLVNMKNERHNHSLDNRLLWEDYIMGDVKDWAFTHVECSACGKCFLPWETKHKMSHLPLTSCSEKCDNDMTDLFEAIELHKKDLFEAIGLQQTKEKRK